MTSVPKHLCYYLTKFGFPKSAVVLDPLRGFSKFKTLTEIQICRHQYLETNVIVRKQIESIDRYKYGQQAISENYQVTQREKACMSRQVLPIVTLHDHRWHCINRGFIQLLKVSYYFDSISNKYSYKKFNALHIFRYYERPKTLGFMHYKNFDKQLYHALTNTKIQFTYFTPSLYPSRLNEFYLRKISCVGSRYVGSYSLFGKLDIGQCVYTSWKYYII